MMRKPDAEYTRESQERQERKRVRRIELAAEVLVFVVVAGVLAWAMFG